MQCPSCGYDNIDGVDTCDECQADMRSVDVPQASSDVEQKIMSLSVSKLTVRQPHRVTVSTSIRECVEKMRENTHACVLVVDDDDRLIGILTEKDIVKKVAGREAEVDLDATMVADLMTASPDTIHPGDSIQYAIHRMAIGNYRHLPIETDGDVSGLILSRDVIDFIERNFREAVTRSFRRLAPPGG